MVEPPVAVGRLEPPVLFPARYLLFLSPANDKEAAEKVNRIVGTNELVNLYAVYATWMGAVSLDSRWRELPNRRIDADYGPNALEELVAAVRSVCEYLRATDEEKQKLAEQFRKRGGVYKQFIDDALTPQRQPDP